MPAEDFATLKTIALVLFLAFWLIVVVRLLTTRADRYAQAARIPLDDDVSESRTGAPQDA